MICESTLSFALVTLASSSETLSSCVEDAPALRQDAPASDRPEAPAPCRSLRGESWSGGQRVALAVRVGGLRADLRDLRCRLVVLRELASSRTPASKTSDGGTALAASSRFCWVRNVLSNETVRGDFTVRAAVSPTWMLNCRGKMGKSAISSSAPSATPNPAAMPNEIGAAACRLLSMSHLRLMITGR